MKKIMFVCTGNTCRSPMAKHILIKKLKMHKIKGVKVDSAGLSVSEGSIIEDKARKTLHENGIRVGKEKSKQLKSSMVDSDTIIICMTKQHKSYLKQLQNTVLSMGEIVGGVDIPDPYGMDISAYKKCYNIIDFILDEVVSMLKKGEI